MRLLERPPELVCKRGTIFQKVSIWNRYPNLSIFDWCSWCLKVIGVKLQFIYLFSPIQNVFLGFPFFLFLKVFITKELSASSQYLYECWISCSSPSNVGSRQMGWQSLRRMIGNASVKSGVVLRRKAYLL